MRFHSLVFVVVSLFHSTPISAILDLLAKKKAILAASKIPLFSAAFKAGGGTYQPYYVIGGVPGSIHGGGSSISSGGSYGDSIGSLGIQGSGGNTGVSYGSSGVGGGSVGFNPVTSPPVPQDDFVATFTEGTVGSFDIGAGGDSFDSSDGSIVTGLGGFGDLISSFGTSFGGGGESFGSSGISGGVSEVGVAPAYCPAVTVPVIKDITTTQFLTEYVTVPQPITSYVFSTVPFHKTVILTSNVLTTVTGPTATGLCTSTRIHFTTATVKQAQVVSVTNFVTHTDLVHVTQTVVNTLTDTLTVTQTQTLTQSVYTSVIVDTVTSTRTSATLEHLTNTVTSQYNLYSSTVAAVAQPIWVTTTDLDWVPFTVTRTLNKTSYKTVWKSCGGGGGGYGY